MIIRDFEKLRGQMTLKAVWDYVTGGLSGNWKQVEIALRNLELLNNFSSFSWTGDIAAGAEVEILNRLDGIPTQRLIVRSNGAGIIDGPTAWNKNHLYLSNSGASLATVTVVFLK